MELKREEQKKKKRSNFEKPQNSLSLNVKSLVWQSDNCIYVQAVENDTAGK